MSNRTTKRAELVAMTALARGATVAQAALQSGVSERTVYRYLKKPEFQARIESLQNETIERTTALLTAAAVESIHSLVALQDPSTPPSVRRSAARDIIGMGLRLREAAELEKRLAALENKDAANSEAAAAPCPTPARRRRADPALIAALATGATVVQAAANSGVSERTVYRRLKDPAFGKRIEAARADMVKRLAALLISAALFAAKTLVDLQNATTPAAVRRNAARDIIELSQKLREITVLEKRLVALEERMVF